MNQKSFELLFGFNFNNFQNRKDGKYLVDCYNILIIGIDIIEFHIVVFILYFFSSHIFSKII